MPSSSPIGRSSDASDRPALPIAPMGLRVEGRPVLVVGAGRIAVRKAAPLIDVGARVTMVAPDHVGEAEGLDVTLVEREFRPSDLDGVWLVVTATGIPAVDGAVFEEAERRRIWCNAADDPEHCSAILPAVVRRGDVTVTIATGGTSPAGASWLRRRIEAILDDGGGTVVEAAADLRRRLRAAGRPTEVQAWPDVMAELEARLMGSERVGGSEEPAAEGDGRAASE